MSTHMVPFESTELIPLEVDRKVDKQKGDFLCSVQLKDDSFLVHTLVPLELRP